MKNPIIIFIFLLSLSCETTDESPECPDSASCISNEAVALERLDSLRSLIINMAIVTDCSESSQCGFIGLGMKPCGGPWEYLIYAKGDNEALMINLVNEYNDQEKAINEWYGRASDCAVASPPDSVVCSERCVAFFGGEAFSAGTCCQ